MDPVKNIPITSLQSNALVVEHNHKHKEFLPSSKQNEVTRKRMKIDTWLLHDRFHRPDGVFATKRAHDIWRDVAKTFGWNSSWHSSKPSTMPGTNRQPRSIQHICSDAGTEFCSDTLENGAVRTKFISIQQLPNIKNKMALLKDTGEQLQNLLILFFYMQDSIGSSFIMQQNMHNTFMMSFLYVTFLTRMVSQQHHTI